jgi:hypothetical protein
MQQLQKSTSGDTLADLLERILDKGIVIAGDIKISIGEVELLQIKIRLIVCSVDKAMEIGINWWKEDPALSSTSKVKQLEDEIKLLRAEMKKD